MGTYISRNKNGSVRYYAFPVLRDDGKWHINFVRPNGMAYFCSVSLMPFDTVLDANYYLDCVLKEKTEDLS